MGTADAVFARSIPRSSGGCSIALLGSSPRFGSAVNRWGLGVSVVFSADPAAAAAPYLGRGLGGGSRGRLCGGRLGFACEWERIAADVSPHPFTRRNLKRQGVFSVTIALQKIGIKAQCERGLPGTGGSGTFLRGPESWGAGPVLAERPLRTCATAVRCRGEPRRARGGLPCARPAPPQPPPLPSAAGAAV